MGVAVRVTRIDWNAISVDEGRRLREFGLMEGCEIVPLHRGSLFSRDPLALTALNRGGKDYPDLTPDGRIGERTLAALDAYLASRGKRGGETVLLRALEALQGERYLRLAERRPANEAFLYGWLANRIG